MLTEYYHNKKVLVTGHTGFKGSWLVVLLNQLGAKTYGYSLEAPTTPSLYELANIDRMVHSEIGDIRDFEHLLSFVEKTKPDVVIHLAAQPLVKEGYANPRYTYETNVMGTVNILESVKEVGSVESFLNVTTDKVYDNIDQKFEYTENDSLDGYDPYSNSKSCSELATHSYKRSFFNDSKCAISTARAGNVIGGGDFAKYRIIPDCVESATRGTKLILRNPNSIRPYQHVLEPLFAYLSIIEAQAGNHDLSGSYNVGPELKDCVTTGKLASMFCSMWGNGMTWYEENDGGPHESNYLRLNCALINNKLGYTPRWHIDKAIEKVVEWSKAWYDGKDVQKCMIDQINEFNATKQYRELISAEEQK